MGIPNLNISKFPIVGIGASAGGLSAFEEFFKATPIDSGIAYIVISHLDPNHTSILPELLQNVTAMKVSIITEKMEVAPNSVYVIPPNKYLSINKGILYLMDVPDSYLSNMPIDSFLVDLAQDQGMNSACIILSGTGTDGTKGLKAIKDEFGLVIVQAEESAKFNGMPRSAIATDLADFISQPSEMPQYLVNYFK